MSCIPRGRLHNKYNSCREGGGRLRKRGGDWFVNTTGRRLRCKFNDSTKGEATAPQIYLLHKMEGDCVIIQILHNGEGDCATGKVTAT